MDPQLIALPQIQNFLLCLARILALIAAIPSLSGALGSIRLKIGLAATTALLVFPAASAYGPQEALALIPFGLLLINEVLLGVLIGLVAQMVFAAVSFSGTIIGYQMGFAAANIFDPQTTQQLSVVSQFISTFALLLFLALDLEHFFFKVILESYRLLPPGIFDFSGDAAGALLRMGGQIFVLGIRLSAPVLALLLISALVLGILSRVFPQLNVFMLSFPLNIGLSLIVIGLTLGITSALLSQEFDTMGRNIMEILSLLS